METKASLTARQKAIFNHMITFTLENLYQPSYRELMEHFEIRSPNGIRIHLKALERKGLIDMSANGEGRAVRFLRRTPI